MKTTTLFYNGRFTRLAIAALFTSAVLLHSCKKEDSKPETPATPANPVASAVLNMPGKYENKTLTATSADAGFFTSAHGTLISFTTVDGGDSLDFGLVVIHNGNMPDTGTYYLQNAGISGIRSGIDIQAASSSTVTGYFATGTSSKVRIISYGKKGEQVTGTFSGTFTNVNNTITVSNGTFTAKRGEDL